MTTTSRSCTTGMVLVALGGASVTASLVYALFEYSQGGDFHDMGTYLSLALMGLIFAGAGMLMTLLSEVPCNPDAIEAESFASTNSVMKWDDENS